MSLSTIALLIVSGLFVGFINTLAGGGTIISISVFMFLGLPPMVANARNRIQYFYKFNGSNKLFQKKILNIRTSLKYAIPVAIGSLSEAILLSHSAKKLSITFYSHYFVYDCDDSTKTQNVAKRKSDKNQHPFFRLSMDTSFHYRYLRRVNSRRNRLFSHRNSCLNERIRLTESQRNKKPYRTYLRPFLTHSIYYSRTGTL